MNVRDQKRTWIIDVALARHELPMPLPLTLFFETTADHEPHLDISDEVSRIYERVQRVSPESANFGHILPRPSVAQIRDALGRHKPEIIHLSGHMSEVGELHFRISDGYGIHAVGIDDLADLIRSARAGARLVMLNTCYSDGLAEELVAPDPSGPGAEVEAVVGFAGRLYDRDAATFSAAFYAGLAVEDSSVEQAFDLACKDVRSQSSRDFAANLHTAEGVDAGGIVLSSAPDLMLHLDMGRGRAWSLTATGSRRKSVHTGSGDQRVSLGKTSSIDIHFAFGHVSLRLLAKPQAGLAGKSVRVRVGESLSSLLTLIPLHSDKLGDEECLLKFTSPVPLVDEPSF